MNKVLALFVALTVIALAAFAQCSFPYTQVDMGNLDACNYPTLTNNPGHGLSGIAWLGPQVTGEAGPRSTSLRECCAGRDNIGAQLDPGNDGVAFFGAPWTPCSMVSVLVQVTGGPNYAEYAQCGGHLYLSAWKDGNLDGDFDDVLCDGQAPEWMIEDAPVTPGVHFFTFRDPGDFDHGIYNGILRFRLTSQPVGAYGYGLADASCPNLTHGTFGLDFLGEVEDYIICDLQLSVELANFDVRSGNGTVDLNWATAAEIQNDHFEVMRDGVAIARIASKGNGPTERQYSYTDNTVSNGTVYSYTLVGVDVNGGRNELRTVSATPEAGQGAVTDYVLSQNFPNPFNPTTSISFDVKEAGFVSMKVYNMVGQEVATLAHGTMAQGRHTVSFDATNLPSGLYIYRMEAANFSATKKMLLMK
ncbi:MAG TPA: T9SS type A sorting domain-containing protein [bacterium]